MGDIVPVRAGGTMQETETDVGVPKPEEDTTSVKEPEAGHGSPGGQEESSVPKQLPVRRSQQWLQHQRVQPLCLQWRILKMRVSKTGILHRQFMTLLLRRVELFWMAIH